LANGGIIGQARERATLDYKKLNNFKRNNKLENNSPNLRKIDITHIIGLLSLLAIGLAVSIFAFLSEKLFRI